MTLRTIFLLLLVIVILGGCNNLSINQNEDVGEVQICTIESAILQSDMPGESDRFGYDVAIDGDNIIIGDPGSLYPTGGVAQIYELSNGKWKQTATLLPDDDLRGYDGFGYKVDIHGNTAVVAAHEQLSTDGVVYVFTRTNDVWIQTAVLTGDETVENPSSIFGCSLELGDGVLVIGSHPGSLISSWGVVYEFRIIGDSWEQVSNFKSEKPWWHMFASSVALDSETIIVGSYCDDVTVYTDSRENLYYGAAYIFQKQHETWSQVQKLEPLHRKNKSYFGWAVDIENDTAMIGAPYSDTSQGDSYGRVYVFEKKGGLWTETQILTSDKPQDDDCFGQSTSISDDIAIIGSRYKASTVFSKIDGKWTQTDKLAPSTVLHGFGQSLDYDGNSIIVGASSSPKGTAFIYQDYNLDRFLTLAE